MRARMLMLGLCVAFLAAQFAFPRAMHAEEWCWDDPIVSIGGKVVSIRTGVAGKAADVEKHVDEARVTIIVPHGVDTRLIASTSTYFDEKTQFKRARKEFQQQGPAWRPGDPIPVRVEVTFKSKKYFLAAVEIRHAGGSRVARGSTEHRITIEFTLR